MAVAIARDQPCNRKLDARIVKNTKNVSRFAATLIAVDVLVVVIPASSGGCVPDAQQP